LKADEAAEQRGSHADADRNPVGRHDRRLKQVDDVVEREFARRIAEGADDDLHGRQNEKQKREQQKRHHAKPRKRHARACYRRSRRDD
jgi:hypothetical protein